MTATIVIPAAGAARRMGGEDKLLRHVDGVPLIRRAALHALASGQRVLVTLRPNDGARRAALAGLALRVLPVGDHATGMSASLRCAAADTGPASPLMILPADMPEIGAGDLERLWTAHAANPERIIQGMAGSIPGHPVILPPDIVPEMGLLSGDTGARAILTKHHRRILPVPLFERRAILDLDTPQDWEDWSVSRPATDLSEDGPRDPFAAALDDPEDCVLAVITAVHGTGWRRAGAMMCLWRDGRIDGQLTGGCIEADLALHVRQVLDGGRPVTLRYGIGSPFFDIRLPCGGGLDITLFPVGDTRSLRDMACLDRGRVRTALRFQPDGAIGLDPTGRTGWRGFDFVAARVPEIQFLVFGQGEDASLFARLAKSAGYNVVRADEAGPGAAVGGAVDPDSPDGGDILLLADARTAVLTFHHDHEKDVGIIAAALRGPACYVGALGSRRVAARRLRLLQEAGIDPDRLARLHAPVGLIPSTRDARGLALSILAEIVALDLALRTRSAVRADGCNDIETIGTRSGRSASFPPTESDHILTRGSGRRP
ncbi:NTP transferase domain-containing protein [Meridianimarinicoccus sp. RP-17]|uniref:NTP transferase domain-containing protein n=1 Tax=Meridianimarinicoccus zhengii TaxID=2056810 RepID=UPI000DAE094F|nr:NTP transferase domain-containing protein [Phycocomes zhengii]